MQLKRPNLLTMTMGSQTMSNTSQSMMILLRGRKLKTQGIGLLFLIKPSVMEIENHHYICHFIKPVGELMILAREIV